MSSGDEYWDIGETQIGRAAVATLAVPRAQELRRAAPDCRPEGWMRKGRGVLSALLLAGGLAAALPGEARAQSRWVYAAGGGAAGVAAGGYLSLALVVVEARRGHYLQGLDEFLGWRSAPVLLGGGAGAIIGFLDQRALERVVIGGAAGGLLGLGAGALLGPRIWDDPEARWAGGAIGLGAGLVLGNTVGLLWPSRHRSAGPSPGVPVTLVSVRF